MEKIQSMFIPVDSRIHKHIHLKIETTNKIVNLMISP